jgi:histone deacetylase 1/2
VTQNFRAVADFEWYPDSGATHHLTPDAHNFTAGSEFFGAEQIYVGNGTGLSRLTIKHIGDSVLHSF